MKDTISKSDFLASRRCVGMAWYGMRAPQQPDTAAQFRIELGREVGELARTLYADGVLVSPTNSNSAEERTLALITDQRTDTIFEATMKAGRFVARADILRRNEGGWHVIEVKSSFSDTKSMEDLVEDLAYTVMVFQRAGLSVTKASLLLLSRGYRYGDSPTRLFEEIDKTPEVAQRAQVCEALADGFEEALFADAPPPPRLAGVCRECEEFGDQCLGAGVQHTVLEIPKLSAKALQQFSDKGIIDLSRLPADVKLTERQQRVVTSALSGEIYLGDGLGADLDRIAWPCHYLDFETVASILPLYEGHACHQQVLTQFSIHHRDSIEGELRHSEFLADAKCDCQRELAQELIRAVGEVGSVVMYSSFEKTRIKALQEMFPDLKVALQGILDRLVDLCALIGDNVYHPDFRGRFTVKKVLPALIPDLSYDTLAVRNGDMAIERFARMARGEIVGEKAEETRRQLLEYCSLDTLAMARLHEKINSLTTTAP